MTSEYDRVARAAEALRARSGKEVVLALVLGSGLGEFAERISDPLIVPYSEIPEFPKPSVASHAGRLVLGELAGVRLAVLQGRVHSYEGYAPAEVVRPLRTLITLGARGVVITNAAGGISSELQPGDLMLIRDQINLTGQSPLHGPLDARWPDRFVDLTHCYHPPLAEAIADTAQAQGVILKQGVYAGLPGGAYETPAEVRMLARLGVDAVGMSTVLEAIAANHLGARVAGISCITNFAAGRATEELNHGEVQQTAQRIRHTFADLLAGAIPRLAALVRARSQHATEETQELRGPEAHG